jgi:hypothetical protein
MSYRLGRIYKIITGKSNKCYIGSTFNELRYRFNSHKSEYKKWKNENKKCYITSFDLFEKYDIDECKIILIKEYKVCDKLHLQAYEQLWINKLKSINQYQSFSIKYLSNKMYDKRNYIKNRQSILEYQHKYNIENREKIAKRNKEYRENNKDKLKLKSKEYREKNKAELKERRKEYDREYNNRTAEKRNAYNAERMKCDICEKEMRRDSILKHKKAIHKI